MLCPLCSTEAGRALRNALGDAPITVSLLATFLPFLTLAVVVAWIEWLVANQLQGRAIDPAAQSRKR